MKKINILLFLSLPVFAISSCSNGQVKSTNMVLEANDFADKINATAAAVVVDVRTPEEFSKGHLKKAKNFDWNGDDFQKQISQVDKSKPVFVYCLSGGRSGLAAKQMRSDGFKEVFELSGGMMKWRAAKLPEEDQMTTGMTKAQFDELIVADKTVLIDFYADWCMPCKKMKPYLEEISKEMASTVTVIRINADDNQQLCRDLKIDALPVLQIYKNKSLSWSTIGFIEKAAVVKEL